MHSLATFIVESTDAADRLLEQFQEGHIGEDKPWGMWDWWSQGGRWSELLEKEGCEETESGHYVLSLEKAREWKTPIVVTPFGHVFDSDQLTYEASRGEVWDATREALFDEFIERRKRSYMSGLIAVMVDVHT